MLKNECCCAQGKYYYCHIAGNICAVTPGGNYRDSAVFELLKLYQDSLSLNMQDTIAETSTPLSKTQPESTLGNWISDAARSYLARQGKKVDVCLFSYGCIGKDYIAPGPILLKDCYELIPLEHKMVLVSLSGTILKQLCDSIAGAKGMPVSGLSFTIDKGEATNIMIGNYPLNDHLVYSLLINEYLLTRYRQLLGRLPYQQTGLYLRNILRQEAIWQHRDGSAVHSVLENRIIYAE